MDGDDLFGDLLGPKPAAPAPPPSLRSSSSVKAPSHSSGADANSKLNGSTPLASDVGTSRHKDAEDDFRVLVPTASTATTTITLARDELQELVQHSVQEALDATFGKFVKSLRTVLEDLSRRVDASGDSYASLKDSLAEVSEQMAQHTSNSHARFTSLDLAVKEVERGVQALRDKQELHEAQALLAKLSDNHAERGKSSAGAAAPAPDAAPAPAAQPAASPAPGPAPAPAPAPVTAPAPAPSPAPMQQAAPAPSPPPQMQSAPVYAPAPAYGAPAPMQVPQQHALEPQQQQQQHPHPQYGAPLPHPAMQPQLQPQQQAPQGPPQPQYQQQAYGQVRRRCL